MSPIVPGTDEARRVLGDADGPFPLPVIDALITTEIAAYVFEFPADSVSMVAHLYRCDLTGALGFTPNGERPAGGHYCGSRERLASALYGLVDITSLVASQELTGSLAALSGLLATFEQHAEGDVVQGAPGRSVLRAIIGDDRA